MLPVNCLRKSVSPNILIDELIAGAGITKRGFFYHFKDKGDLAKALLLRYLENDAQILDDLFRRAKSCSTVPSSASSSHRPIELHVAR